MDDIRPSIPQSPKKFLDQVRLRIRQVGLAYMTEKTYILWIRRFINFHKQRHPSHMGAKEVTEFLTYLGVQRHCSVNTQKTALNALSFLYNKFLGKL